MHHLQDDAHMTIKDSSALPIQTTASSSLKLICSKARGKNTLYKKLRIMISQFTRRKVVETNFISPQEHYSHHVIRLS